MNQIAITGDTGLRAAQNTTRLRFGTILLASGIVAGILIGAMAGAAFNTWQSASGTRDESSVVAADPEVFVPERVASGRDEALVGGDPMTTVPNHLRSERAETSSVQTRSEGGEASVAAADPEVFVPDRLGSGRDEGLVSGDDPMTTMPNHLRSEREETPAH